MKCVFLVGTRNDKGLRVQSPELVFNKLLLPARLGKNSNKGGGQAAEARLRDTIGAWGEGGSSQPKSPHHIFIR